jgi:mRNA interferase MazF
MKMFLSPLMEKILNNGDIYLVTLDPTIGDEIQKRRPVLILNGGHEKNLKLAIVVPITNWQGYWEDNPFFVSLEPDAQNCLEKKSVVVCFQIRSISHQRFLKKIGNVSSRDLDFVKQALALILDIDPEHCL